MHKSNIDFWAFLCKGRCIVENYKILIVEDDEVIASSMEKYLTKWGYEIYCVNDFANVVKEVSKFSPELILLDIMLPFYNGFYWCSEIRKFSKVPIIFISSANQNMDIVMAMDMGGDDFIAKPFDLSVLRAKVSALIRRSYSFKSNMNLMEYHGVFLNLGDAKVTYKDQCVELTKNEFKILQMLMENGGEIVTRESLMIRLWDSDCFVDDNTLTVNITRIRKKLKELGADDFIKTKKGIGYYL